SGSKPLRHWSFSGYAHPAPSGPHRPCLLRAGPSHQIRPERHHSESKPAEQLSGAGPVSTRNHLYIHSIMEWLRIYGPKRNLCSFVNPAADFHPCEVGGPDLDFMGLDLATRNFINHTFALEIVNSFP